MGFSELPMERTDNPTRFSLCLRVLVVNLGVLSERSWKGGGDMAGRARRIRGYVLAAGLGAVVGGIVVAAATRAIPGMVSQVMSEMWRGMMGRMQEEGIGPAEM